MQYVRGLTGSVSKTWNSINPATLSGAIDVVVVEQEDGSLACSPFHVRFGKFSLLRPSEKKVEFQVNGVKQDYAMKLGDGGEAFFVFETSDDIPEALQTSPLVSPASSPEPTSGSSDNSGTVLQEPEYLDLSADPTKTRPSTAVVQNTGAPPFGQDVRAHTEDGLALIMPKTSPTHKRAASGDWSTPLTSPRATLERSTSEEFLSLMDRSPISELPDTSLVKTPIRASALTPTELEASVVRPERGSHSPPQLPTEQAINRAKSLSKKLHSSNIISHVTDTGDLMLDIEGYKSSEEDALRAELIARKILAEELEGNYDIGALIGADEHGNLWIYSSEEAKEAAARKQALTTTLLLAPGVMDDAASDPGYHSDGDRSIVPADPEGKTSANAQTGLVTSPQTPPHELAADPSPNYAKTLRLTSNQLKALNLKPGPNSMSFSVNRATCTAYMYYWSHNVPVVISDIDGTITKSDALGHVLNMLGRDWTHIGVAKLYTDIVANGYNILYLTSRSVGQADTTRAYLHGISQEGYRLPRGPVILSPDRTIAALRREVYLRKPEVFKMACLRDIQSLFAPISAPFYAGFGNRLTDALSYRSVNIPSTRIFTINSNAEVSLDLLTLTKYKSSYVSLKEVVDHFFPPVGLLVKGGGEDFTDFSYWRERPLEIEDFSDSESEGDDEDGRRRRDGGDVAYEEDDRGEEDEMGESFMSRRSIDSAGDLVDSILEGIEDEERSRRDSYDDANEEDEVYDDEDEDDEDDEEREVTGKMAELGLQDRGRSPVPAPSPRR